jgi:hypothetical protein
MAVGAAEILLTPFPGAVDGFIVWALFSMEAEAIVAAEAVVSVEEAVDMEGAEVADMADSALLVEGCNSNALCYQRHHCGLNKGSYLCSPCEPAI